MKIAIPELNNPVFKEITKHFSNIEFIPAEDPDSAAELLSRGEADSLLSGLDFSSRDVVIACKNHLPLKSDFFSSSFICKRGNTLFALADGGINKFPTKEQLYCIVEDTARTFTTFTGEIPKIAMLSYSTNGSGGENPDLEKIHFVIKEIRKNYPEWKIDGEMQLDTAINPEISQKKFSESKIGGNANVLIVPDLNSGNILYKALEQLAGFTVAGPIIQGFEMPLADLSRGSTVKDIELTLEVIIKLHLRNHDV